MEGLVSFTPSELTALADMAPYLVKLFMQCRLIYSQTGEAVLSPERIGEVADSPEHGAAWSQKLVKAGLWTAREDGQIVIMPAQMVTPEALRERRKLDAAKERQRRFRERRKALRSVTPEGSESVTERYVTPKSVTLLEESVTPKSVTKSAESVTGRYAADGSQVQTDAPESVTERYVTQNSVTRPPNIECSLIRTLSPSEEEHFSQGETIPPPISTRYPPSLPADEAVTPKSVTHWWSAWASGPFDPEAEIETPADLARWFWEIRIAGGKRAFEADAIVEKEVRKLWKEIECFQPPEGALVRLLQDFAERHQRMRKPQYLNPSRTLRNWMSNHFKGWEAEKSIRRAPPSLLNRQDAVRLEAQRLAGNA